MRPVAVLVVAALLALPGAAVASHFTAYRTQPVEHDDLGRSHEPDFAATSVLGLPLLNCAVDAPPFWSSATARCGDDAAPTGLFVGHATYPGHELAPGCTRDSAAATPAQPDPERAPSGLCGLWTVGVRPNNAAQVVPPASVGEDGMNVPAGIAPGAFSPGNGSEVVFLDGKLSTTMSFNRWLPVGEALGDAGFEGFRDKLPYSYIPWAWFGKWRDLNGNGVIDHVTPGTAGPSQNEFTYYGNCVDFNGAWNPKNVPVRGMPFTTPIEAGLCKEDINPNVPGASPCMGAPTGTPCGAKASIDLWLYPGGHHGGEPVGCLGAASPCVPADLPGNEVLRWLRETFRGDIAYVYVPPDNDPLLGPQGLVIPDDELHDRTADTDVNRQWVGFGGNNGALYDDGTLTTLVAVFAANCAPSPAATKHDLATCTFVDVDVHTALHPMLDELLYGDASYPDGGLKGAARGAWLLVRDNWEGMLRLGEGAANGRALYEATLGPQRGLVDDAALSPGWSREPNHPLDVYPGVAWAPCAPDAWPSAGEAQHRGSCNVPAHDPLTNTTPAVAYGLHDGASNGGAFRGWADHHLQANVLYHRPVSLITDPCMLCTSGPALDSPLNPPPLAGGAPDGPEDHARTIPPGQYYIQTMLGTWRDAPKLHAEAVFGFPGPAVASYPADGWVGFLARATGQYRYRGYADVNASDPADPLKDCATEKGPAHGRPRAECNPYLDGHVDDPQNYVRFDATSPSGAAEEFIAGCQATDVVAWVVEPADGVWSSEVIVWHGHGQGFGPLFTWWPLPDHVNPDWPFAPGTTWEYRHPGDTAPIVLAGGCFEPGWWGWNQPGYLIWPGGNAGDDVLLSASFVVSLGSGFDTIVDVDLYRAWRD